MKEGFTMFKDTESSARKFITDHKKGKSVAKLPID
jgi:hypothetical protein